MNKLRAFLRWVWGQLQTSGGRHFLVFLVCFAGIGLFMLAHLYSTLTLAWLFRFRKARWFRRWQSQYFQTVWATIVLFFFQLIMRVRIRFEGGGYRKGGPFIILSNHTHTLDIVLLLAFFRKWKLLNTRWVVKRELVSGLALWRSMRIAEFPMIERNGDPKDLALIEEKSAVARSDGAHMMIFPEGTRFKGPKVGSGYTVLNPPRAGGVCAIWRAMPTRRFLTVRLAWDGVLTGGKGMFDGEIFFKRDLLVQTEMWTPKESEQEVRDWLNQVWQRHELMLLERYAESNDDVEAAAA